MKINPQAYRVRENSTSQNTLDQSSPVIKWDQKHQFALGGMAQLWIGVPRIMIRGTPTFPINQEMYSTRPHVDIKLSKQIRQLLSLSTGRQGVPKTSGRKQNSYFSSNSITLFGFSVHTLEIVTSVWRDLTGVLAESIKVSRLGKWQVLQRAEREDGRISRKRRNSYAWARTRNSAPSLHPCAAPEEFGTS